MQLPSAPLASDPNLAALLCGGLMPVPGPLEAASAATTTNPADAFAQLLAGADVAQGDAPAATKNSGPGGVANSTPALALTPTWPFAGTPLSTACDAACSAQPEAPAATVASAPPAKKRAHVTPAPEAIDGESEAPAAAEAAPQAAAVIDPLALALLMPCPVLRPINPATTLNLDLESGQGGEESELEQRMAEFLATPVGSRNRDSDTHDGRGPAAGGFSDPGENETEVAATPTRAQLDLRAPQSSSIPARHAESVSTSATRPEFAMAASMASRPDRPEGALRLPINTDTLAQAPESLITAPGTPAKAITNEASYATDARSLVTDLTARATSPENFAAAEKAQRRESIFLKSDESKHFLNTDVKEFESLNAALGTGVANSPLTMPASANHVRTAHSALEGAVTVSSVQEGAAQTLSSFAAAPEATAQPQAVATPQRAVEAVLKAVEHSQHAERPLVNLQFSVGGAELAVRVEVRADEIRATFRTDSSELRAALSQEWQHANNSHSNSDRSTRTVTPVFTDASGFAAFSGDSSSRQRGSRTRQSEEAFAVSAARGRSFADAGSDSSTSAANPAATPRISARTTSRHLSTLA